MPTGVPRTEADKLCRRIVQDIVALAKLADDGQEARVKLAKLRALFADAPAEPAPQAMMDDLAKHRRTATRRTRVRAAG